MQQAHNQNIGGGKEPVKMTLKVRGGRGGKPYIFNGKFAESNNMPQQQDQGKKDKLKTQEQKLIR